MIHVKQDYDFLAYIPYTIYSFHPNCAISKRPVLEFPKKEFEVLLL